MKFFLDILDCVFGVMAGMAFGTVCLLGEALDWFDMEGRYFFGWILLLLSSLLAFPFLAIFGPFCLWVMYREIDPEGWEKTWPVQLCLSLPRLMDKGYLAFLRWVRNVFVKINLAEFSSLRRVRILSKVGRVCMLAICCLLSPIGLWGKWRRLDYSLSEENRRRFEEEQEHTRQETYNPRWRFGDGEEIPNWQEEGF